jgi:hypothetical protein
MKNSLRKLKDKTLSAGLMAYLNTQYKEIGAMLKLDIDSASKRIYLQTLLEGENEPIDVTIGRYELKEEGGNYTLALHDVKISRPWMQKLLADQLEGRAFPIPSEYAKMMGVVL